MHSTVRHKWGGGGLCLLVWGSRGAGVAMKAEYICRTPGGPTVVWVWGNEWSASPVPALQLCGGGRLGQGRGGGGYNQIAMQ